MPALKGANSLIAKKGVKPEQKVDSPKKEDDCAVEDYNEPLEETVKPAIKQHIPDPKPKQESPPKVVRRPDPFTPAK